MNIHRETIPLDIDRVTLTGELALPEHATALVIFSHGSGSSRFSPRNNFVAQYLHRKGIGTFLFDLLTDEEDQVYTNRFNIHLLADRLIAVTKTLLRFPNLKNLSVGYFGASTGAAAALMASAVLKNKIKAVVSRGGRPDLSNNQLYAVESPTLLLVGDRDTEVLELNRQALEHIDGVKNLIEIKGASHLFEEPGTLNEVASLSADWFEKYLSGKMLSQPAHQNNIC